MKRKEDFVEKVLYTEEEIASRVKEIAAQVSEDYKDIKKPLEWRGYVLYRFVASHYCSSAL